jgi:ribose/xylose/arabinose/galactoside ABC-type transport system permease subunit
MSDTISETPTRPSAVYTGGDERLAYRGIFQRLFIRPEIGALIGVLGLWVFFWAVAVPFGRAQGASNIIDYASTLGIMAVAVSMLMIGGEFDLSAGAMTGAMGILVILLSKAGGDFGGLGLNLWFAIPISLAVALAIGFMNGWLVERTKLPSFIITLGTYYVLIGAKLGFSKLIVDQIQVGDISEAEGHGFWVKIFAAEWNRNDHTWGQRDRVYVIGMMLAMAVIVIAMVEMHFSRRHEGAKPAGLPVFGIGAAAVVVGLVLLHSTDNNSGNWLGAAVVAGGTIVGLYGFGMWRFQPLHSRGSLQLPADVIKFLVIGVAGVALSILIAAVMKSTYPVDNGDGVVEDDLFFPFTKQGFRATAFLVLVAVGFTCLLIAAAKARRVSVMSKSFVSFVSIVALVVMAFFIQSESEAVKFRTEAFSAVLGLALFVLLWTLLGLFFEERTAVDQASDRLGMRLITAGTAALFIALVVKLLFTTPAEIEAGIDQAKFSMRTVWFLAFTVVAVFVLGKTRFGSWTFAVGGNKEAARQVGVPAARTKTQLFMLVSGAAWLVGMLLAFRLNTIQANTGNGEEFDYIIAAVVGGTLLTGGYGTALGGALGAAIIAQATLGIPFSRWNSDWRFLFLGVTLLLAVLANRSIRAKAESIRR